MTTDQHLLHDFLRAQRRGGIGFNMADWGRLAAWLFLLGAACFWFPIEWKLTQPADPPEIAITLAFGLFMTVGPAIILSSFIPASRAGQLLLKLNLWTVGKIVGIGSGLFLLYHAYQLLYTWWDSRPLVHDVGLTWQMAIVGIICTILYPALMFAPVSREELAEQVEQAEQVELYELQTRNRIAGIMAAHERALDLFAKGLANMTVAERDELATYMTGVVSAIDESRRRLAGQIEARTGVVLQYESLTSDPNLVPYLDYVARALRDDPVERSDAVTERSENVRPLVADAAARPNVLAASGRHADVVANVRPVNVPEPLRGFGSLVERSADDPATIAALRAAFAGGAFMARDLGRALPGIGESTAGKLIAELLVAGQIEQLKTRGYYRLTEQEAR